MSYLMAILLGLVQGVAEFLPISSSGHLTLLQHFFQMEEVDNLYNILLHFATLIAVCVVYWRDIVEMVEEFFRALASLFTKRGNRETPPPPARRLVMLVIVGTLPLLLAFHPVTINGFTASRTGVGISLDFWQAALVLLTALVTGVLAVRLVERRLVKKRFLPPEEKTEAQRKNDRLLRTTALTLCAALALSAFAARALVGFGDTRRLAEGTEFTDFDSFKRYMRKPVKPTYDSGGGFATETAVAESPLYYENDTPIYRSQTEGATIEDDNGNVLCNFIWRNRSVVFWRTGPKADGYLPVTVYTQEAMSLARQKAKHIDMVFYGVYAVEVVAAAAYYLRKREK